MNKIYLTFAVVLITMFSCRKENSEKVDQDKIWTDYRVVYRSDLDSTLARVTFREENASGVNLKLSSKSSLLVNNQEGKYDNLYLRYENGITGGVKSVDFKYTDLDDNVFANTVEILNDIAVPGNLDTIYKDSTMFVPWEGSPIEEGETVWMVLDGSLNNKLPYISIDSVSKNGVYIVPDSLAPLSLGNIYVHFERWYNNELKTTSAGGQAFGHYISKKKLVKLVSP